MKTKAFEILIVNDKVFDDENLFAKAAGVIRKALPNSHIVGNPVDNDNGWNTNGSFPKANKLIVFLPDIALRSEKYLRVGEYKKGAEGFAFFGADKGFKKALMWTYIPLPPK